MSSRKRSFRAVDADSGDAEPSILDKIRNMWHFANLCQWIYTFGKAAKIDESIDIEEIEVECLKPSSTMLEDIALALLKLVSSHRGLTHEIFDEQARKQYLAKAPYRNPFGDGEERVKFSELDVFTKIRVLQQLTQWTMIHPERIRDKMEEQKDTEQTNWRIEPYGWDAEDRTYFVLDDNRVYRLTEAPPPPPPKPKKSKNWRAGRRSSKRRRTTLPTEDEHTDTERDTNGHVEPEDDGLGGMTWECLAVSLDDVRRLLDGFNKTRDENEKILRRQLADHLVPILEKQEESRKRKELQRERDLANLAKMANAKRSSRIASKAEQQKQVERAREEEQHRREAEAATRREEAKLQKVERERGRRMVSREQRLREREARRVQHEEELAQLSEDSRHMTNGNGRLSERRLKAEIERNQQALKEIEDEEEDWVFDCVCGLYGQVDDGTHSVACERCNIWQHSKCLGIKEQDAERPEFQFVCASCIHREQEAKSRSRPTIKLRVSHPEASDSRPQHVQATMSGNSPSAAELPPPIASSTSEETGQMLSRNDTDRSFTLAAVNTHASNGDLASLSSPSNAPSDLNKSKHESSDDRLPIFPAPVALTTGNTMRGPVAGSHQGDNTTPPKVAASPTNGIHNFQGDRAIESALSTPNISRDIYRATFLQNGSLPSQAGLSPTKHSPPRPTDSGSASKFRTTTPILPPVTLSPSPRQPVLTPPSKSSEPTRPLSPLGGR
ncbi:Fc.00g070100.m01.CDS01 [Cosmosporella sp. VM-42]